MEIPLACLSTNENIDLIRVCLVLRFCCLYSHPVLFLVRMASLLEFVVLSPISLWLVSLQIVCDTLLYLSVDVVFATLRYVVYVVVRYLSTRTC